MSLDNQYIRGADKLRDRIATIRRKLDLPKMTDEIGSLLERRTKQRFDRQVTPDYVPWAPLKPETLRRKAAEGYGGKGKLRRTDALRNAIKRIRGGLGSLYSNTGAGVRIGIQDPQIAEKGRALNDGTDTIPARQFLGVGRLDVKAVDSLLRRKAAQIEGGL